MSEPLSRRLVHTFESVRLVSPDRESCQRLCSCYQQAFVSDAQLLAATDSPHPTAINGVTEPMNVSDFDEILRMPDTVAFEVPCDSSDVPRGFLIVRFATRERNSRQAFREYFFEKALCGQAPSFYNPNAQKQLNAALSEGNLTCSVEFLAQRNSTVAAALLMATYKYVVQDRFNAENARVVGKCLDSVQIGTSCNDLGNLAVKTIVEGVAMQRMAIIEQHRVLRDLPSIEPALLRFAVYLGDFAKVRKNAVLWKLPFVYGGNIKGYEV